MKRGTNGISPRSTSLFAAIPANRTTQVVISGARPLVYFELAQHGFHDLFDSDLGVAVFEALGVR